MKKSLKKNYIYNLVYQIIIILLPIITTPYLARTLQANGNGIYSYTISVVTYFIIFGSLGINLYGQREIAYNQDKKKAKSKIFMELFLIKLATSILSLIIFYILFARSGNYSLYYKILILEFISNILDISWLYQGNENFKAIVIRNTIIKFISIVSIFIFIKSSNDVWKYILIYSLSNFFGNISLWFKIKDNINFIHVKNLNFKRHIKPIIVLFIPQIAIRVYTLLDKTMIGSITNDMSEVGYYEQTQKIINLLLTIITSISTVMLPRIANCFSTRKYNEIKKYMNKTFSFIYFLAFPMIFGIILISNNFVPIFFGKGYEKVVPLLCVMSIIMLFIGLSSVIGNQYLLATKKQKGYTISVICGAIVNFLLNMLLIKKYLSVGATIATIIAEFSVMAIQFYFIRNDFKISLIISQCKNNLISSIIMFVNGYLIGNLFNNNLLCLIIKVIVSIITYLFSLFLLNDQLFLELINIICKRSRFLNNLFNKASLKKFKNFIIFTYILLLIALVFIYYLN